MPKTSCADGLRVVLFDTRQGEANVVITFIELYCVGVGRSLRIDKTAFQIRNKQREQSTPSLPLMIVGTKPEQ